MTTSNTIGRYQVQELLGQGGMGVLYLAFDPMIARPVALKLLRVDSGEVRERFVREARLAARLQHPNIVTVYDVGEHQGQPFIAMEYIPGETMAEIVAKRTPIPLPRKLSMMIEVCRGLAYAHQHNIVHRDVKPANLMVSRESQQVKILDFGIARAAESTLTKVGMLMGTPNYMSPEQVRGQTVDHRSDIFSVGAVLYELIAYRKAFKAADQIALLHTILSDPPEPLTSVDGDLDSALADIVTRTLAKRGEDRYQDLKTLAGDLTRVVRRLEPPQQSGEIRLSDTRRPATTAGGRVADPVRLAERRAARIAEHLDSARSKLLDDDLDGALVAAELAAELDSDDARVVSLLKRIRQGLDNRKVSAPVAKVAPTAGPGKAGPAADRAGATVLGKPSDPAVKAAAAGLVDSDKSVVMRASAVGRALPSAVLIVVESPDPKLLNCRIPIMTDRFEIGREGRDLAVRDPQVSRAHVAIEYAGDAFLVRDLSSANGTFLNNRRLSAGVAEPLAFGMAVWIGSTVLKFADGRETVLPDLTQATVEGRYTLEQRMRQSTQGVVYAALDRMSGSRVALRLPSPELFRHPAYRAQFEREVDIVSELDHQNILRMLDSYADAEVRPVSGAALRMPALCYAFYEGGTLQDVVDAGQAIPYAQIARWIGQIAAALDHAHQRQIVHANLKPTVIVFDGARTRPFLTDFASAQRLASARGKPPLVGTPAFMAPEQWDGAALTPAVDQFGLAVVAYYLVTGRRPFEGQDDPAARRRNFDSAAPLAHEAAAANGRPGVPAAVSPVLRRALSTAPNERYESVRAFAEAFFGALRGATTSASPRDAVS
jgi:serine/threonine protein kinase